MMFKNSDKNAIYEKERELRRNIIRQDSNFTSEQFKCFNEQKVNEIVLNLSEPDIINKIAVEVDTRIVEPAERDARADDLVKLSSEDTKQDEKKKIISSLINEMNDEKKDEVLKELLDVTGLHTKQDEIKVPDKFPGFYCVYGRNKEIEIETDDGKEKKIEKVTVVDFGIVIDRTKKDVPKEMKDFRVAVEETKDIIETYYSDDNSGKGLTKSKRNQRIHEAWRSRDKHIYKLHEIAADGLNNTAPKTDEALSRLEVLKENILRREGKKVKNRYLSKLAGWALVFAVIALVLAIWSIKSSENYNVENKVEIAAEEQIDEQAIEDKDSADSEQINSIADAEETAMDFKGNEIYVYLFIFIGSLAGTIISYLVRNEKLEIKDLVVMEEDMVAPIGRLLCTGLISIVFMLFLVSKVLDIEIGGVPMSEIWRPENLEYQLLIGVIAGLTGNGLAGKLYDKSHEVVGAAGKK